MRRFIPLLVLLALSAPACTLDEMTELIGDTSTDLAQSDDPGVRAAGGAADAMEAERSAQEAIQAAQDEEYREASERVQILDAAIERNPFDAELRYHRNLARILTTPQSDTDYETTREDTRAVLAIWQYDGVPLQQQKEATLNAMLSWLRRADAWEDDSWSILRRSYCKELAAYKEDFAESIAGGAFVIAHTGTGIDCD